MKYFATFFAVIALLYASVMALRIPSREISWAVQAYIIAQCVTHLFGLLGLQKKSADTDYYLAFFTACYFVTVGLAMIVAGRMLLPFEFGSASLVIVSCVFFTTVVTGRVMAHLLRAHGSIPIELIVVGIQAAVLGLCGLVTLISLMEQSSPAMSKAALVLALYWIGHSAFSFAFALGILNKMETWIPRNEYVPAMLVIVFFGWLGFYFSGLQREAAAEAVESDKVQLVEAQ